MPPNFGTTCWQGPEVVQEHGTPTADDVTRMNATPVDRLCQPRSVDDVRRILAEAAASGRKVAMRGTQHSMGGQCIPSPHEGASESGRTGGGYVLDFKRLNHVSYDEKTQLVTCGPGATWADLIEHLNDYGKAPRTMQSYSTFSVGGTLAVNGHGITTDHCMSESVVSFKLVKADGQVVTCTWPQGGEDSGSKTGAETQAGDENKRLWELVLGGYGMFGAVVEVTMRTADNVHLDLEYLQLDSLDEFAAIYGEVLKDEAKDVEVKIARLNIMDLDKIDLFIYRRAFPLSRTVSRLDRAPAEQDLKTALLYKWVMPILREQRAEVERATGSAIDMSGTSCERNQLLYVSAEPLARLCSPLLKVDDTFVLQEYFVPYRNFKTWVTEAKPIYAELVKDELLILLNTTIRFCRRDTDQAFLSYTRRSETDGARPDHPAMDGMFAFVLYYRLPRTKDGDERLAHFGDRFIDLTLSAGGTFYLPYRLHYKGETMRQAYPNIEEFFQIHKQKYDPTGLFDSLWFRKYGLPLCSSEYQDLYKAATFPSEKPVSWQHAIVSPATTPHIPPAQETRSGFYRRLVSTHRKRKDLIEGFLVQIFNLEDPAAVYRHISRAVWKVLAKDPECPDLEVYRMLQAQVGQRGPLAELSKTWKALRQLSNQKRELARETASLLSKIGRRGGDKGLLRNYVSIGDGGKMVLPLRDALDLKGKVWVVNEDPFSEDIPAVLERGCQGHVGQFVQCTLYQDFTRFDLESGIADLVTMNQGLHHLQPSRLHVFLAEVWRILRPGGVFIVREHNATAELMDMLDLAHSVFNAVTGVSAEAEASECRAFRPLLEWRQVVEQFGFVDSMVYEMELGDPTWDEMMCFLKPFDEAFKIEMSNQQDVCAAATAAASSADASSPDAAANRLRINTAGDARVDPKGGDDRDDRRVGLEGDEPADSIASGFPSAVQVPAAYMAMLNQLPSLVLSCLKAMASSLDANILPNLRAQLSALVDPEILGLDPVAGPVLQGVLDSLLTPVEKIVNNYIPFFEKAELQEFDSSQFPLQQWVPPELFLLVPALKAKKERGEAAPNELMILSALESWFGAQQKEENLQGSAVSMAQHPTPEEMFKLLKELTKASPELTRPQPLLDQFGFNPLQRKLLDPQWQQLADLFRDVHAHEDLSQKSRAQFEQAASLLDTFSWHRALEAFDPALEHSLAGPPEHFPSFTRSAMLGTGPGGENNVWHRAALAFLGSPHMQLKGLQLIAANRAGLKDFVQLYHRAQELGKKQRARDPDQKNMNAQDRAIVRAAQGLSTRALRKVEMKDMQLQDIEGVSEVVSATFGYKSFTAEPDDVTEWVRSRLQNGVLRLSTLDLKSVTNQGSLLDRVRLAAVSEVTGATRELVVRYWSETEPDPESYLPRVEKVLESMMKTKRVQARSEEGLAHAAPFTWYKLSEWLQVEIVQTFGKTMEHTPWFCFPFMEFMYAYSSVLYSEVQVVMGKHDAKAALTSEGFVTSLVPGLVMGAGFAMLEALAFPTRLVLGDSYTSLPACEEELVVWLASSGDNTAAPSPALWQRLDPRIGARSAVVGSKVHVEDGSLWVLTVPTFKPFSEILVKMALQLPAARVLQVSGQHELQLRVTAGPDADLQRARRKLQEQTGCQVMFDFQLPAVGDSEKALQASERNQEISLCVRVPYLMGVLRVCVQMKLSIFQIYDFYC